jgi:hypothetical protein
MDGDLETAEFFYGKARRAGDADARVGLATQRLAEGKRLFAVATESNRQVDGQIEKYSLERRLEKGPIELTPREDGPAGHNSAPLPQSSPSDSAPAPQLQ